MNDSTAIEEIRAFNRFYTNTLGVLDRHILGTPFSLTEARVLLEIYHHGHCNARAVKDALNVDEGYLSRTIDKLAGRGLVVKRRCTSDGRRLELTLSARGRRTFLELKERMEAAIAGMIEHLSAREVDEVVGSMRRIRVLLTRDGGRA